MDKEYEMYYKAEQEIFEMYHRCGPDLFTDSEKYEYTLDLEVPDEDLELQVKISKNGDLKKYLVCDITKMSAYEPDLLADIKPITINGTIIFSLVSGENEHKITFELDDKQIQVVRKFLEFD